MPTRPSKLPTIVSSDFRINGLQAFHSRIEREFFSEVVLRQRITPNTRGIRLVLELTCDLQLSEMLTYFRKQVWGGFVPSHSSLTKAIESLRRQNEMEIEVDELSVILNDCILVVHNIYPDSITEQLHGILNELDKHYSFLIQEDGEIPYEIYLPVFEGTQCEDTSEPKAISGCPEDFYKYWGLYYESEEDAVIYDLSTFSILPGDLYMLDS